MSSATVAAEQPSPEQTLEVPDTQAELRAWLRSLSDALRNQGAPKRLKIQPTPEDKTALGERLAMYAAIAKANLSDGFVQMPAAVLHDPELSSAAKAVYQHLLSYFRSADDIYCWPSQETISRELGRGFSVRTVIRALAELEAHGYIEKWRRGQGQVNRYFLNPLAYAQSFGLELEAAWDLMCQIGSSGSAKNAEPYVPIWQRMKNEDIEHPSDITNGFSRSGTAADLGNEAGAGAAIRKESRKPTGSVSNQSTTQPITNRNPKTPPREEIGRENAKRVEDGKEKRNRRKHAPGEVPPPLPMYIAGQLAPISLVYGDKARKSSQTSVAWCYADAHARGMDEYEFVDFFNEAKDAVTAHGNTIRGSIMAYFLTCVENSVERWCAEYDKALAKRQAAGEPAIVASETEAPEAEQPPADLVSAPAPDGANIQEPVVESPAEVVPSQAEVVEATAPAGAENNQAEQATDTTEEESQAESGEEHPDLEIDFAPLQTSDPTHGADYKSAEYWGILLVKHFGPARYQSFVVPTLLKDRYGVVLFDKATGKQYEYRTYTAIGKEIYPPKRRHQ